MVKDCCKGTMLMCGLVILVNLAQIAAGITLVVMEETAIALLLLVAPIISLIALRHGPDKEERRLMREVRKARLKQELEELQK